MARYAGPNTKVIDVAGATVIPGLIDNHFHFTRGVETWNQQARFEGVGTRREALQILAAKAAILKPGDWIMVQGGWTPRQFADAPGGFTLEELDGAAPKSPRCLCRKATARCMPTASRSRPLAWIRPAGRAVLRRGSFRSSRRMRYTTPCPRPRPRSATRTSLTSSSTSSIRWGSRASHSLGQSDYLAARAAKGPLPVRLWETLNFNATDPASATKAAELIARTKPNQFDGQHGIFGLGEVLYGPFFDLAPRKDPWPAEIMNEYASWPPRPRRRAGMCTSM